MTAAVAMLLTAVDLVTAVATLVLAFGLAIDFMTGFGLDDATALKAEELRLKLNLSQLDFMTLDYSAMPIHVTMDELTRVILSRALLLGAVKIVILLKNCCVGVKAPNSIGVLRPLRDEHFVELGNRFSDKLLACLLYTSPSPRD